MGRKDLASQTLPQYIDILIQQGNIINIPALFSEYETQSGYFRENGEIAEGLEIYYWVKGNYFLSIRNVDLAIASYLKCLENATSTESMMAACEGLFKAYSTQKKSDLAVLFAQKALSFKDSIEMENSTIALQNIQSMYKYERQEQLAHENKRLAQQAKMENVVLFMACVLLVTVMMLLYLFSIERKRKMQQRYERLHSEYNSTLSMYRQAETDIMKMKDAGCGLESLVKEKEAALAAYAETIQALLYNYLIMR